MVQAVNQENDMDKPLDQRDGCAIWAFIMALFFITLFLDCADEKHIKAINSRVLVLEQAKEQTK